MKKISTLNLTGFILLVSLQFFASHNRSGEITYKRIPPYVQNGNPVYTYSITVTKYMNDDGGQMVPDRCVDTVYFGDGAKGAALRVNGPINTCNCGSVPCGSLIVNNQFFMVKKSVYSVIHTYAGAGTYVLHSNDPNRTGGIRNIPNSDQVAFYLDALLIINSGGINSSPELTNPPVYIAGYQVCYYYDLMAVDADGDSLAYEIIPCRGLNGQAITGFFQPESGVNGTFNINTSGVLTWCAPQFIDEYSTAIEVREYRKNSSGIYELIGKIVRDMQIIVNPQPGPASPISATGIGENAPGEIAGVYPNPFTAKLELRVNNLSGRAETTIFSADGKQILQQAGIISDGNLELDLETLKPGIYTLQLKTENKILHRKIVKE